MKTAAAWIGKRAEWLIFAGIFLLGLLNIREGHDWGGDFSQYIAQAYALINGTVPEWLEKSTYIVDNSPVGLTSTVYPWGYPLLLVPNLKICGTNFLAMKLEILACYLAGLFTVKKIFESRMEKKPALVGCAIVGTASAYLVMMDSAISDIPCMMFSMLAVYFVEKRYKESEKNLRWNILSGVFLFLAWFTRTQALVLWIALLVTDICLLLYGRLPKGRIAIPLKSAIGLNRRFALIPHAVFAALAFISGLLLPAAGGTYLSFFDFSLSAVTQAVLYYTEQYMNLLGIFTVLLSVIILGMLGHLFDELYSVLNILGTTALVCLFGPRMGPRYLLSVYPLVVMFMCMGIAEVKQYLPAIAKKLDACIYIGLAFTVALDLAGIWTAGPGGEAYTAEAAETYSWINDHLDDSSVIAFAKPRVLYLETGNYTYWPSEEGRSIKDADYALFCLNSIDSVDYYAEYEDDLKEMELVFENSEFRLYRVGAGNPSPTWEFGQHA